MKEKKRNSDICVCIGVCVYCVCIVHVYSSSSSTYMLCRTHQPQWGSPEPRHSLQVEYWPQASTGTLESCRETKTRTKYGGGTFKLYMFVFLK